MAPGRSRTVAARDSDCVERCCARGTYLLVTVVVVKHSHKRLACVEAHNHVMFRHPSCTHHALATAAVLHPGTVESCFVITCMWQRMAQSTIWSNSDKYNKGRLGVFPDHCGILEYIAISQQQQ